MNQNALTLDGGTLEIIGGKNKYGIRKFNTLTFGEKFDKLIVKTGQTGDTPIYIYDNSTGAEFAVDTNSYKVEDKDGVRTITPKPAEE